jgi:hypothetical protein
VVDEQLPDTTSPACETKQERRDKRRKKEKAKMAQHGRSLARIYKDAVSKRAEDKKAERQSG